MIISKYKNLNSKIHLTMIARINDKFVLKYTSRSDTNRSSCIKNVLHDDIGSTTICQ